MTEAEWQTGTDPTPLPAFMGRKTTDRKLRLFMCACCRSIWPLLQDDRSRRLVETVERFVDGEATWEELGEAEDAAREADEELDGTGTTAAAYTAQAADTVMVQSVAEYAYSAFADSVTGDGADQGAWERGAAEECRRQAQMLRDIITPFCQVTADPSWRSTTVLALARTIYAEHAFDQLPVLADALEEVGCTSDEVLAHCRGPGPHVRGCWVIDLILGK